MAKGNLVTGPVPQDVVNQVIQKQNEIINLLTPYKVSITNDEKRRIPKAADEVMPFIEKGISYVASKPRYVPQFVNAQEIDNDYQRTRQVKSMQDGNQTIAALLNDLGIVSGSDLYATILEYYNNARRAVRQGDAEAKVVADDLGKLFARSNGNAAPVPPTT